MSEALGFPGLTRRACCCGCGLPWRLRCLLQPGGTGPCCVTKLSWAVRAAAPAVLYECYMLPRAPSQSGWQHAALLMWLSCGMVAQPQTMPICVALDGCVLNAVTCAGRLYSLLTDRTMSAALRSHLCSPGYAPPHTRKCLSKQPESQTEGVPMAPAAGNAATSVEVYGFAGWIASGLGFCELLMSEAKHTGDRSAQALNHSRHMHAWVPACSVVPCMGLYPRRHAACSWDHVSPRQVSGLYPCIVFHSTLKQTTTTVGPQRRGSFCSRCSVASMTARVLHIRQTQPYVRCSLPPTMQQPMPFTPAGSGRCSSQLGCFAQRCLQRGCMRGELTGCI